MGVKVREKPPGSGVWWIFIHHRGKRRSRRIGRKDAAIAAAKKIAARLTLGIPDPEPMKAETPLFEGFARTWLEKYANLQCKDSTAQSYRVAVEQHLIPFFASKRLGEIDRSAVKGFISSAREKGLSPKTVFNYLVPLRGILEDAVEDEIIEKNVALKTGRFTRDPHASGRKKIITLTLDELGHLLSTTQSRYSQHYPLLLCAARTGARLGELLALRWSDVQFGKDENDPNRFVRIERNCYRGRVQESPKTSKSRRKIDMSKDLRAVLLDLRSKRETEAIAKGRTLSPEDLVFPGQDGRLFNASYALTVLHMALKAAGLRGIRFHDLRHTFATILLYELHAPIQYVSAQLGHSSIKVTVDTYGHPKQGQNIEIIDRFAQENRTPGAPSGGGSGVTDGKQRDSGGSVWESNPPGAPLSTPHRF